MTDKHSNPWSVSVIPNRIADRYYAKYQQRQETSPRQLKNFDWERYNTPAESANPEQFMAPLEGTAPNVVPGTQHPGPGAEWNPQSPQAAWGTGPKPPNWDQLNPIERVILATKPNPNTVNILSDTAIGRALRGLNDWTSTQMKNVSPMLGVFDFLAEGTERAIGVGAQLTQATKTGKNALEQGIKPLWEAGSLAYDVAAKAEYTGNPPRGVGGPPTDISTLTQSDADLVSARIRLAEGVPLAQVKDEYKQSLGALAIRSELLDAAGHILLDPLNLILPAIEPISSIQKARAGILREGTKAFKTAEEEYKLAQTGLESANKILETAKGTKNAEEIASAEAKLAEATAKVDELAIAQEKAAGTFNPMEKIVVKMTGGFPTELKDTGKWIEAGNLGLKQAFKAGGVGGVLKDWNAMPQNWFKLTPESKAFEVLGNVSQVTKELISRGKSPEEAIQIIANGSRGALGKEFGHIVTSPAGRASQAFLRASTAKLEDMLKGYIKNATARGRLAEIANAMGTSPTEVMNSIKESPFVTFNEMMTKATETGNKGILQLVANGKISPETMKTIGKLFEGVPYDELSFKAYSLMNIEDVTTTLLTEGLKVKPYGFWYQFADATKSVETLAFLRGFNPAYPVKNAINNEITMAARGVWGLISPEEALSFFEKNDIPLPTGMLKGFGPAETAAEMAIETPMQKAASGNVAHRILGKAMQPKEGTFSAFFHQASQDIKNIGKGSKLDTGGWAAKFETAAAARATYSGYLKAYDPFMREAWTGISKKLEGRFSSDVIKHLGDTFLSSYSPKQFRESLTTRVLNYNAENVMKEASRISNLDRDIAKMVMGDEEMTTLSHKLEETLQNGGDIDKVIADTKLSLETKLDEQLPDMLDMVKSESAARIQSVDGLSSIERDLNSGLLDRWEMYLKEQAEDSQKIRDGVEGYSWEKNAAEKGRDWERFYAYQGAIIEGMEEGAKNSRFAIDGASDLFKKRINNIKSFNEQKYAIKKAYWDKKNAGEFLTPEESMAAWGETQNKINGLYTKLQESEARLRLNIDYLVARGFPEDARPYFLATRNQVNMADIEYKKYMYSVYNDPRPLGMSESDFWKQVEINRNQWQNQIYDLSNWADDAARGDQKAIALAGEALVSRNTELTKGLETLAKGEQLPAEFTSKYGVNTPEDINKYLGLRANNLEGLIDEFAIPRSEVKGLLKAEGYKGKLENAPLDIARRAFKSYREKYQLLPFMPVKSEKNSLMGLSSLYNMHTSNIIESMGSAAKKIGLEEKIKFGNLSAQEQKELLDVADEMMGKLSDARLKASDMAKVYKDASLLDYTHRTKFDVKSGMIFPYSFWGTHTMYNWALWNLERPAMYSTYLKIKQFMDNHSSINNNMSQRFRGTMGIPTSNLPFWPKWMGDAYTNPLGIALPFSQWEQPFEQYSSQMNSDESRANNLLQDMLENKEISQQEYDSAIQTHNGDVWNSAINEAQSGSDRQDAFDFVSMMFAPHAPIMWAYNVARGTPENIGPFLPATRNIKAVTAMLGVPGGFNIEGGLRKALGLPAYDKYEDYRINRAINDMMFDNEITPSEALDAINNKTGDIYTKGVERAGKESALPVVTGMVGMSIRAYPEGEKKAKQASADFRTFSNSIKNETPEKQKELIGQYIEAHPELQSLWAINKSPQEAMQSYLVDKIWEKYNSMPKLWKQQVREQLGEQFTTGFLKENAYGAITPDTMAMWARQMSGSEPGKLDKNVIPLQLAPPEIAEKAQAFYETRDRFPDWYKMQEDYFKLDAKGRKEYKFSNPTAQAYFNWRDDFLLRNPTIAPYITDSPPKYKEYKQFYEAVQNEPNFTIQEWKGALQPEAFRLFGDYMNGNQISPILMDYLDSEAKKYGLTTEELINKLENAK